jgi:hypothetical protein
MRRAVRLSRRAGDSRWYPLDDADALPPFPESFGMHGLLPARANWVGPEGAEFQVGFGTFLYSPQPSGLPSDSYFPFVAWCRYSDDTYTRISPDWYVERWPWNLLYQAFFHPLNR